MAAAWAVPGFEPKAIKQFPLDERTVYLIKVGKDQPTTIAFPGKLSALEGGGITTDPQTPAPVFLQYKEGRHFFTVRALVEPAAAALNVIWNNRVYVLKLQSDPEPFRSVTFYEPAESPGDSGKDPVGPTQLLGLLDRAKSFHVIQAQYPDLTAQIETAAPQRRIFYKDFDVVLAEVFRFDPEDTLVFKLLFFNHTEKEIFYQPQSLAVRIADKVYYASLSDASGIMPPGHKDSKTGQIEPGASLAYFAVRGTPDGGRHNLSVKNDFNVIVTRLTPFP
jgi:hypothetical protein